MIPVLHAFQNDLVNGVRKSAATNRIIVIQGATGSGKNTVAAAIVRRAYEKGSPTLFMVHRRKLVEQISDRLTQFQVNHGIIMRGEPIDRNSLVQVASRDTLTSRYVDHKWIDMPEAKLVLVDECHHAADPKSDYRRILDRYPLAKILLISATPVGSDGRGLGPWAQAIVCAPPTSQLVRDGFLVPVKCFAPDRKKKGKKFVRGIAGDLVESWKMYAENQPTVLFCSRVQHSLDAIEAFKAQGINAAHVDASTPDEEREQIFEDVASGTIKILSNVRIVGEGVDVPELSCCQIFCEMGSRVAFLQACGRIMRTLQGKKYGILIDHSGAVFKHGFPDEDTEWTLEGNVDENFAGKHKDGLTEKALYCKQCEMVFHGSNGCPQCGRVPVKPPRSIFAPPPVETTNELLVEADRKAERRDYSKDLKIEHWMRCLYMTANRGNGNGTFGMAAQVYKQKFGEFPGSDFPNMPARSKQAWKRPVAEVHPNFRKKKAQ